MANDFWDAAQAAQKFTNNYYDRAQADLDRLHTQIGDALGAADDESHYNQIVQALDSSGLDVSKYKLKPNGPSWETMRDLALSQIGKAMAQKTSRADLASKQASLYTPYAGTMSGGGGSPAPQASQPAAPVTPAFDFSTLPIQSGMTTPQYNEGAGRAEAQSQTGTPPASLEQTPSDLSVPSAPAGAENPVTRAAGVGEQNYPELTRKPISPAYVTKTPSRTGPEASAQPENSQAIVYAPKLPGQSGFVYRFPPGFKKEEDSGDDKRPNSIKETEYFKKQLDSEFGVDVPLGQVPGLMDLRKRGVPLVKKVDGTLTASDEFLAGSKAAAEERKINVQEQRADQSATTAGEKNFQAWAQSAKAAGATNSEENLRYIYTQERKGREVKFDPASNTMTVIGGGAGEPREIQALRARQEDLFSEYKDQGLKEKPSIGETQYIQKARDLGVNFNVVDGKLAPVPGNYAPGSKTDLAYQNLDIAKQRAKALQTTGQEKDLQKFIERARNEGIRNTDLQLESLHTAIKNGGVVEVDPDTHYATVEGAWKGTKASNMADQVRIADAKLDLQKDRLDLAKKTQSERQDLLLRKFEQTKYAQSLDYQSKLAMAKAISAGDAKMYPRISAGYTAMAHLQKLDETARSNPELTNQVIGWISSKPSWQAVKDEIAAAFANKDQYMKSTGRSEQFMKIMQGLASLDAELDRTYFQGQGNLAEESRKRLDPLVMGLKNSPNAETFINGINCLKGYVNEIINTALPSDFARDPDIAKSHAESIPKIEKFRHEQRGLYDTATQNFNAAVSRATPPGSSPILMPNPSQGVNKINVPLFTQDDPDIKKHIDEQISAGTIQHGQTIHVKLKDGSVHEVRLP
jgi:hypothetical protein